MPHNYLLLPLIVLPLATSLDEQLESMLSAPAHKQVCSLFKVLLIFAQRYLSRLVSEKSLYHTASNLFP